MTELDENHAALVADPESNSIDILLPVTDPDVAVPELFVFLCACATRFETDPDWVEGMINWFLSAPRNHLH